MRVAVIAAFALLIAQLGAMTHTYAHSLDGTVSGAKQSLPGSRDLCADCLNFAPLLAPSGGTAAPLFNSPPAKAPPVAAASPRSLGFAPLLGFRSRAPPTTL
jgi:hypothetical protein